MFKSNLTMYNSIRIPQRKNTSVLLSFLITSCNRYYNHAEWWSSRYLALVEIENNPRSRGKKLFY